MEKRLRRGIKHTGLFLQYLITNLVLIVAMALSVWMTKDDEDKLDCVSNMTQKTAGKKTRNPYFEGMDAKTAKIEYKRLLKIYHPDNESGDMEQTQAVIIAYNQYCLEHGCR